MQNLSQKSLTNKAFNIIELNIRLKEQEPNSSVRSIEILEIGGDKASGKKIDLEKFTVNINVEYIYIASTEFI